MQYSLFTQQPEAVTVSELTRYIRQMFEVDYRLQDIWVQGEISNLSRPSSGHVYFSLKDPGAAIRCVMWKTTASTQANKLREGDAIIAHGKLSVYEPQGAYQLYVDAVQAAGAGDLFQQFELLKAKLQAEGLFDPDRKRPLPEAAHTIGIVTSPTGAALQDMLNIIRRRWPLLQVVLAVALESLAGFLNHPGTQGCLGRQVREKIVGEVHRISHQGAPCSGERLRHERTAPWLGSSGPSNPLETVPSMDSQVLG